jgi:hypothetical protein
MSNNQIFYRPPSSDQQPIKNQPQGKCIAWKKIGYHAAVVLLIVAFFVIGCLWSYIAGTKKQKEVAIAVDFTLPVEDSTEEPHRYQFLSKALSDYICDMSVELGISSNLVVSILMVENPEFDAAAVHKNENGTVDCGLFQLNDRYVWTTFKDAYWFNNIELDPFNWKHNAYIAMNHIRSLQDQLKLTDEVIMAYNCGIGAVMNGTVPAATKVYLAKVKNNMALLKGAEE